MIPFHRLLISTAIVFCAGFAVWGGVELPQQATAGGARAVVASSSRTAALIYYVRHSPRFLADEHGAHLFLEGAVLIALTP